MTLSVTPTNPQSGQEITVSIKGSSKAGQNVSVAIDDGNANTDTLSVSLDTNGDGSATWTAPNWEFARFNYGSCPQVSVTIT